MPRARDVNMTVPARVFRRVDRGEEISPVRVDDGRFAHYVDRHFDGQLLPGWRVVTSRQANWDGGPDLRQDVRVCDLPEPHGDADRAVFVPDAMARAELLSVDLVDRLRPWGAIDPRWYVWHVERIDRVGGSTDPLSDVTLIVRELAETPPTETAAAAWADLAARGAALPSELDDPYGTFGPGGPPRIPRALVGRRVAELADPFEVLAAIHVLGVHVAIAGDEVRFAVARTAATATT